ncbi:MAG: permease [Phascolarctobacterium sp.]|uniref:permease n=1 Tax=Phascolarctobacterium sp. TaxID=2049039 RepID=UPI0025CEA215|nr:permease [Phascolarctobacterium sp.]MCC8157810.1 permease [Phascolarctobacterium sp.]
MNLWLFVQDQILGMKWLNEVIGDMLISFGVDINSKIGGSIQFWLYDVIKIFILLGVLIYGISIIESYFPPEKCKKILGRFNGFAANTIAALLGTVTPFCSCSSIPIFIGFTKAGLPLGVTFSFLISSPLVDLGSLVLLTSIFGLEIAFLYVVLGLIVAVVGGAVIDKMHMEDQLESLIDENSEVRENAWQWIQNHRLEYAKNITFSTVKKVFWYVLVGVGIGAFIHNWIPESFIEEVLGSGNYFSVIIATIIGIPMYADIFGTIPIAEALYYKGAGLGVVLSFMMGVTALSLPSIVMLRKAVKPKLLTVFVTIVAIGIVLTGYFFNFVQNFI